MNSIIINGNLGREPEITMTASGKKLCNFSIANDKGNKEVQWIDCRAWDNKAEYLEKYCHARRTIQDEQQLSREKNALRTAQIGSRK